MYYFFFFFQAEDGIRDGTVTGVQTCALPIFRASGRDTGMRRESPVMRRPIRILAIAAALAAVGALVGWKSAAGTGPATIRIVDRQFSYTRVDVGRHGRSPGDYEVITTLLYNKKITRKP